jgi:DNA-binding response OmpR family regulator
VDLTLFELGKSSKSKERALKKLRLLRPEAMILVMLDNKSTKEVAKILGYGVTDVFLKPFDPPLLVERVEALLKTNKLVN